MPFAVPPAITTRKPLSCERVKVNWEHPVNRQLVDWFLLNELNSGRVYLENVTGGPCAYRNADALPAWAIGINGPELRATANGENAILYNPRTLLGVLGWSIGWCGYENATGDKGMFIGDTDGADFVWMRAGYGLSIRVVGGDADITGWTDYLTPAHFVLTYSGSAASGYKLYRNGAFVAGANAYNSTNIRIRTFVSGYNNNSYNLDGALSYILYWSRMLQHSEACIATAHPYGTPDNPRLI